MNDEIERIKDRIRKMLSMANDKANINESAVAASMAEKLMRKYQLDMSDIEIEKLDARDANSEYEYTGRSCPLWKQNLAVVLANLNDCQVRYSNHGEYSQGFLFQGVGPDPVVAAEIYKYLVNEVERLAKASVSGRKAINSFKIGAKDTLCRRLRELKAERDAQFAASSTGTALVVRKKDIIEDVFGQAQYGKGSGGARSDWEGYYAGKRAAEGINLSDQISGTKHTQLD
jgi:hypothetical protein